MFLCLLAGLLIRHKASRPLVTSTTIVVLADVHVARELEGVVPARPIVEDGLLQRLDCLRVLTRLGRLHLITGDRDVVGPRARLAFDACLTVASSHLADACELGEFQAPARLLIVVGVRDQVRRIRYHRAIGVEVRPPPLGRNLLIRLSLLVGPLRLRERWREKGPSWRKRHSPLSVGVHRAGA